jgi:HAD superfamily hydrolase (TIGR01456 family)
LQCFSSILLKMLKRLFGTNRTAFAFDIDGVLVRGNKVLPGASETLSFLNEKYSRLIRKFPYIFLTNGGGMTEEQKAYEMSKKLEVDIRPSQLILSHTPMQSLVSTYGNKHILVIGNDKIGHVAKSYGFKNAITSEHVFEFNGSVWPFKPAAKNPPSKQLENVKISAILMLYDSTDWGHDLQIMCDVLRSENGILGTLAKNQSKQSVPLYFSNSDFVWSNDYPINRLAQGAFRLALETIYKQLTGHELRYTKFGKPERPTYEYASCILQQQANDLGVGIDKVYAVGDNPASDIQGANNHGWESILVKTGVWQEGVDSNDHNATHVVDNVYDAVQLALSKSVHF